MDAHGQGFPSSSNSKNASSKGSCFVFWALMDPFGLMDLFESGEAPGHQETLKIHYEMIAKGFLLTFRLVMENMNQW